MDMRYTIGVDFGTLSGRALLMNVRTGEEVACAAMEYPHGVMDAALPDGTPLPRNWALQHPGDYLQVLCTVVPQVLEMSKVSPAEIIGVGIDFTASTLLPAAADGTPLCLLPAWEHDPHAYAKLWKHHAAQEQADRMTAFAQARQELWLKNYGGRVSSEWALPKLWQTLEEDPALCDAAAFFVEAADWVVWQMTGSRSRSACAAGYKALWNSRTGYPHTFLRALSPALAKLAEEKLFGEALAPGQCAGYVTPDMARRLGLLPGTAVAVGNVDAHACVPAAGIDGPGKLLAIIGTSTCHMLLSRQEQPVPGICGVVGDGILPGYFGYEAGQNCVGDLFAWFVEHCVPEAYAVQARESGKSLHVFLREKAARQRPGESGLLALDWWNGNRSVLVDSELSGLLLGMTLRTTPEDIYRALLEATAYGTRTIVENYRAHGVPVEEVVAAGGIAQKDPLMMQIYADVLGMPVRVAGSAQGPAMGSAMFAAVAAGAAAGGWEDIYGAIRALCPPDKTVYFPVEENHRVYDCLFAEYTRLHDLFGRGENDVMRRLRTL